MGSCCCLTQKQEEDHSSAVEELFLYLLELWVSTELQGWAPKDAEGEPERHHLQCKPINLPVNAAGLSLWPKLWASYCTESYKSIYISGLAGRDCGKKPGLKCMEKGWRNYYWPSCLLRFFTFLHCQCVLKSSVFSYLQLCGWSHGSWGDPQTKEGKQPLQLRSLTLTVVTLLKSSRWQKSFLDVANDAPFCDFCLYLLYLNCYSTRFGLNRCTSIVCFPWQGVKSKETHMSQPVLTGTPLNNQAVVINSIRLLLLLTAENYSHGTYSLT